MRYRNMKNMKKVFSLVLIAALCLALLAGCGSKKEKSEYNIAIIKLMDHPSLD